METAKLILTFIADIAWPAAVITMFLLLRHPIKALIAKITDIIFKKGDTEVRVNIAKALEVLGEPAKETPDVIPPEDLTEKNYNWPTVIDLARRLRAVLNLYLFYVPLDKARKNRAFFDLVLDNYEKFFSLLKNNLPADELAGIQQERDNLCRRLAPILDAPSCPPPINRPRRRVAPTEPAT